MAKTNNTTQFAFDNRKVTYSALNAYWLSVCADLAYKNPKEIKKQISEWGMERFNFYSRKDTQCFIISNTKMVILSFRGTEPNKIKDIMADVNIRQVKSFGGKVHMGFNKAYNAVKAPVTQALKTHMKGNKTLYITGHSLGGALAVVAANDLKKKRFKINSIYTFGQPRVGDSAYCQAFEKNFKNRLFRFANKDDKVPDIPLKEMKFNKRIKLFFDHAPTEIVIASRNRLTINYTWSNDVLTKISSLTKSLPAHSSEGYVKATKKNINTNPFTSGLAIKEKSTSAKVKQTVNKELNKTKNAIEKEREKARKTIEKEAQKVKNTANSIGKKISSWF